ncbi:MAG: MBL fold metallo-hydrolase [Candidatus Obscuribacterales bacterium]|nr:MBL fold metallo-hydrolase [Candidatus Obscuribacterales bacterium]
MHVTLYGAAREVTGSCYLLETQSSRLLVDCGMFQGSDRLERQNYIPNNMSAEKLDAVVLTHGHLDHCGRLPLLVKEGFSGPIYATAGTIDIAMLILSDAAKIQKDDADRENRRRKGQGWASISRPLFTQHDVELVSKLFRKVEYGRWFHPAKDIRTKLVEAGHILGSACVEMTVFEEGYTKKLVFSGDLGPWDMPILQDPARIEEADLVFMESTYGDRDHKTLPETVAEFQDLLKAAFDNKGKVLIPTFAVGRTQQILYHIAEMFRQKIVPPMPIYLDSPMAIAATELYSRHSELMDQESRLLQSSGQLRKDLSTLRTCVTPDESRALNNVTGPCLILAGAGMCNAGRIMHHLRHNLGLPGTVLIIVGYQIKNSIGRRLLEGANAVKIFGETIKVNAKVKSLGGFSAHAGQSDLLRWLEPMASKKPRLVLMHGESHQMSELSYKIKESYGLCAESPKFGETIVV